MQFDNDNELPRTRAEAKASGLTHFWTGRPCRRGHIAKRYASDKTCTECKLEQSARWRRENPEKASELDAKYREQNLEEFKERVNRYHANNKESISERKRKKRIENIELSRERERKSTLARISTPKGKIENSVKSGIHKGITKGTKASRRTFDLLGYTVDQLMAHLERQFQPGMSWENYGQGGWHIDHKVPLSAHNYTCPDDLDFKRAWALSNLQPLWGADNLSKGARMSSAFQPSLAFGLATT